MKANWLQHALMVIATACVVCVSSVAYGGGCEAERPCLSECDSESLRGLLTSQPHFSGLATYSQDEAGRQNVTGSFSRLGRSFRIGMRRGKSGISEQGARSLRESDADVFIYREAEGNREGALYQLFVLRKQYKSYLFRGMESSALAVSVFPVQPYPFYAIALPARAAGDVVYDCGGNELVDGHECHVIIARARGGTLEVRYYLAADLNNLIIRITWTSRRPGGESIAQTLPVSGIVTIEDATLTVADDALEIPSGFRAIE